MTTTPRTARERARAEITAEIVRAARAQLTSVGPGELSLRAVARDVGMVSSAVYRYFPSRDDLLTALLIEAYDELGAAAEEADARVRSRTDGPRRFRAVAHAVRTWATAHPNDHALLYGSPVPGYAAPEATIRAASRVPRVLVELLLARRAGAEPAAVEARSRKVHRAVAGARDFARTDDAGLGDDDVVRMLMAWTTIIGTISFELFGHLVGAVDDHAAYFDAVLDRLVSDLAL